MKKTFTIIVIVMMSWFTKAQNNKGTLVFDIGNFSDNSGQAIIKLYNKESGLTGIFTMPIFQKSCKILNGKGTISFNDIAYGEYAAILFHDKNSNNISDHGWAYREPLGFSNEWKYTFLSGAPTFEKTKFAFSKDKTNFPINIQ